MEGYGILKSGSCIERYVRDRQKWLSESTVSKGSDNLTICEQVRSCANSLFFKCIKNRILLLYPRCRHFVGQFKFQDGITVCATLEKIYYTPCNLSWPQT